MAPEDRAERPAWERRWIWTASQASPLTEPLRPAVVRTLAAEMRVAPKSASGMISQLSSAEEPEQADGASTIHSAEVVSTALAGSVLVKPRPVVRFESRRRTRWTVTTTLAAT